MLVNILLNLVSSLIMYIVVNSITSQSQQETHNYFKEQIDKNYDNTKSLIQQMQTNLFNELKSIKTDTLSEIKENTDKKG